MHMSIPFRRMNWMMMTEPDHLRSHCSWPSLTCSSARTSLYTATREALWVPSLITIQQNERWLTQHNNIWKIVSWSIVLEGKDDFVEHCFLLPGLKLQLPNEPVSQVCPNREHRKRLWLTKHCQPYQEEFLVPHEWDRNVAGQMATLYLTVISAEV